MESRGVLYAVVAAALFGVSTPAAKILLGDLSPLMLSALLYLGATIALHVHRLDSREAPLSRADLPLIAGITFFGGILGPVLMLFGLKRVGPGLHFLSTCAVVARSGAPGSAAAVVAMAVAKSIECVADVSHGRFQQTERLHVISASFASRGVFG